MLTKSTLKQFNFFSDINEDQLELIANSGELLEFSAGDTIFETGDESTHLFGVVEGDVELSLVFEEKVLKAAIKYEEKNESRFEILEKPITVARVDPGKIFGWSSLVKRRQRTLNARCSTFCRVFALAGDDLKEILKEDTALGYLLMGRLCNIIAQRLQNRTDSLVEAWGEAFGTDEI